MSKITQISSPLAGHCQPGFYGAVSKGKAKAKAGVSLQEISGLHLAQLAWFPGQQTDFEVWLKKFLSASLPGPGQMVRLARKAGNKPGNKPSNKPGNELAGGWLLRPEPGKLWVLGLSGPLLNPARMADYHGLDLTHGRCWLRLSGPNSADMLRRMAALDFSEAGFPIGQFVGTAFDQVPAHLLRLEAGWLIGLPRSYALSCTQLMRETSLQFGLQVLAAAGQEALA